MKKMLPSWLIGAIGSFVLAQFIDGRIAFVIGSIFVILYSLIQNQNNIKKFFPNWILIVFVNIIFILSQFINFIVASVVGCIFVIVVLFIRNQNAKESIKKLGLMPDEENLFQDHLLNDDRDKAEQMIAKAQERNRKIFKDMTGVNAEDIIIRIGQDITWKDIVDQVFRVLEFDRSDTFIDKNDKVIASSSNNPYGYLLVESPILNHRAWMPIFHRDDFWLAASAFDEPKIVPLIENDELLVTYSPKNMLPNGFNGSLQHAFHYVLTPKGTLNSYYSFNDGEYMDNPYPQKLFGTLIYKGEIKVQINSELEL